MLTSDIDLRGKVPSLGQRACKGQEAPHVMIFDSEKVWNVEVRVLRKEKVTVPIGN